MRLGKERIACGAHCYYTCRMKNELYQHIHLSPHLDDVAYSSGGSIYQLTQAGERVLVVSFFTASSPDDSLTPVSYTHLDVYKRQTSRSLRLVPNLNLGTFHTTSP